MSRSPPNPKNRAADIAEQIDWMGGDLHRRLDGIGHTLNQAGSEFLMRKAKGEIRFWYEESLQTIARLDGLRREALAEAKKSKEGDAA